MPKLFHLLLLPLLLTACGQDLHFKISYDRVGSLRPGDPVVFDQKVIGRVVGLQADQASGHLVEIAIPRESAKAATSEADFVLAADPEDSQRQRIEIVLDNPGGRPIAEDEVVRGSYPQAPGLFPFGDILRQFSGALRDLRGQVERFRQEFQRLPDSAESKQLQEEWRRLTDEINKAQSETGETLKKELLPKLEQELEQLRKRMENIEKSGGKKTLDVET